MRGHPGKTIQALRDLGYQVEVRHHRMSVAGADNMRRLHEGRQLICYRLPHPDLDSLSPTGGDTEVTVTNPDTGQRAIGLAECSPFDNFHKVRGIQIALGRLLAANPFLRNAVNPPPPTYNVIQFTAYPRHES